LGDAKWQRGEKNKRAARPSALHKKEPTTPRTSSQLPEGRSRREKSQRRPMSNPKKRPLKVETEATPHQARNSSISNGNRATVKNSVTT